MTGEKQSTLAQVRFLMGGGLRAIAGLVVVSVLAGLTESVILTAVAQAAAAMAAGVRRVPLNVGPLHGGVSIGTLIAVAFAAVGVRLTLIPPLTLLPARIASNVQSRLRMGLFDAFTRASWTAQAADLEGTLQELMTNQVGNASGGAVMATQTVTAGFSLLIMVASALVLNAVAAALVLAAAVAMFLMLRPLNNLGRRRSRALSQAQMNIAGGVGEASRMAEATQVFGVAAAQRERVGRLVLASKQLYFRTQVVGNLVPNAYRVLIYLLIVGALGALYGTKASHLGALGAVVLLLVRAGGYGQAVQGSYQFVVQSLPYVERVRGAEQRYLSSAPAAGDQPLAQVRRLALEKVSFGYTEGRPVLSDISFEVSGGETIGIVGPSGAGKSTLVQILLRLRLPDSGHYLVNDVEAERIAAEDWHRKIAYVPQEPQLLRASVAENIRYFREMSDADVEKAARLARIHDDIVGWDRGYDTTIGPRADAISGGQQQRICIARALAGEPEILILDEPTSALDPRSESLIQESLGGLAHSRLVFIVAHRMSTLDICDRVMVILDGQLDAFDTAEHLLRTNRYYRAASKITAAASARIDGD